MENTTPNAGSATGFDLARALDALESYHSQESVGFAHVQTLRAALARATPQHPDLAKLREAFDAEGPNYQISVDRFKLRPDDYKFEQATQLWQFVQAVVRRATPQHSVTELTERERSAVAFASANQHSVTEQAQPALTVWYGSLPESNGKSNFTAILMRKSGDRWDNMTDGITIDQSEYPDRVRYEADRVRYLIGELNERPDILAYDADKHSGYVKPDRAQPPASTASSEQQASVSELLTDAQILQIAAEQDYGDEDPKCIKRLARAIERAALSGRATVTSQEGTTIPSEADERAYIPQWHTMLSADRNYTDPRTKREEAMCAEIAELRRALTPRATTADEQAAHLTDEGHQAASASLMAAPGVKEALAELAQAGDSVLAPIINAVEMHDATCLNSTIPDETLIWTATSVMGEQLHVTLGDFRRIAAMAAPATSGGSNG